MYYTDCEKRFSHRTELKSYRRNTNSQVRLTSKCILFILIELTLNCERQAPQIKYTRPFNSGHLHYSIFMRLNTLVSFIMPGCMQGMTRTHTVPLETTLCALTHLASFPRLFALIKRFELHAGGFACVPDKLNKRRDILTRVKGEWRRG